MGNLAPGSLEMASRNELTCRLNSPLESPGFTQSVTLPLVDILVGVYGVYFIECVGGAENGREPASVDGAVSVLMSLCCCFGSDRLRNESVFVLAARGQGLRNMSSSAVVAGSR